MCVVALFESALSRVKRESCAKREKRRYAFTGRLRLYKLVEGAFAAVSAEQLGVVILGAPGASVWQLLAIRTGATGASKTQCNRRPACRPDTYSDTQAP